MKELKQETADVIVDEPEENTIYNYYRICEKIKKLERLKESLKGQIIDFSHHAEHIYNNDGEEIASWSHTIREILDTKQLKIENLNIYEKYLKESDVYQLKVFR